MHAINYLGISTTACTYLCLLFLDASKFLYARRDDDQGWREIYDSRNPEHNAFPTKEEYSAIKQEVYVHGKATLYRLALQNLAPPGNKKGDCKTLQKRDADTQTENTVTNEVNLPVLVNDNAGSSSHSITHQVISALSPEDFSQLYFIEIATEKLESWKGRLTGIEPALLGKDFNTFILLVIN